MQDIPESIDTPAWYRYEAELDPDDGRILVDSTLNINSHFNPFIYESCFGKDRLERLSILRDYRSKGVFLYAGFRTGKLMTGPVHTLQGGMQETLLNTAMTWAAATGAIDDGVAKRNTRGGPPQVGTLKFVEVNYKARVTVPGYYRIRADVVDVKRDGSDTVVYDLESVIQELQKGNKWVTLGTGKSQRVFKTPAPNPSPHPRKMFRGAARKMRIDRPVWSETDTFLKAAPGRFLVFDADVERKPGWVKEGAGGFPWRTCFGEGRITKMSAIYDPAAQQMEGSSYFDSGVEGIENGGGFVSPDAFFSILDYWMVETSRQWMTSAGTMQSGGGSVTASMKLTPISLPRVPCLLHYVTKVSRVEGKKIFLTAEAREKPGGTLYATAEALFIAVPAPKI